MVVNMGGSVYGFVDDERHELAECESVGTLIA